MPECTHKGIGFRISELIGICGTTRTPTSQGSVLSTSLQEVLSSDLYRRIHKLRSIGMLHLMHCEYGGGHHRSGVKAKIAA